MIITDKHIFINFPKTGSTFLRNTLKEVYGKNSFSFLSIKRKKLKVLELPNIRVDNFRKGRKDEHGIYSQIPKKYLKNRKVVSIIRNPFGRYYSGYLYKDWQKSLQNIANVKKHPSFPNLTFSEYITLTNNIPIKYTFPDLEMENQLIGPMSLQFILFFFPKPNQIVKKILNKELPICKVENHLPDINFLRNENLNKELFELLKTEGFAESKINFILKKEKENVSNQNKVNPVHKLTSSDRELILEKEKLIFLLFPEYAHLNSFHNA